MCDNEGLKKDSLLSHESLRTYIFRLPPLPSFPLLCNAIHRAQLSDRTVQVVVQKKKGRSTWEIGGTLAWVAFVLKLMYVQKYHMWENGHPHIPDPLHRGPLP